MLLRIGLAILSLGAFLSSSAGSEEETHRVQFRWALGALISDSGDMRLVPVVRDTALKTGDRLLLFVEPRSDCFIYVIHLSPENEVRLMFPKDLAFFERKDGGARMHTPHRAAWLRVDERTGVDTFFLLASAARLRDLEALLGAYKSADDTLRADMVRQIQAHIRGLRRKHRTLSSQAEKPIAMAGVVKDAAPDIAQFAVDISELDFYARTIAIDHR